MKIFCIQLILLVVFSINSFAQKVCSVSNTTFKAGEELSYKILYNWGAIWMNAGEAKFSVELSEINKKTVFHFVGLGSTYPKYDWFYKVRDRYESYADTFSLKPLRFKREANEGGSYTFDDYVFLQNKHLVYTTSKRNRKELKKDSIHINSCTNDVMTAIYYARCLEFSKYKSLDTIPITFVLDGKVYPSYIRYIGKEIITSELYGMVRCIKFKQKLIDGTLFKGGEEMTVWVTDDKNKIPVYVETPIVVGSVKAKLYKAENLRSKLDCIVDVKPNSTKNK